MKDNHQEELKAQYQLSESQKVDQAYDEFDQETQSNLLVAFEEYLTQNNNQFILGKYADKGLNNRIVKSIFRTFLREHYASLLPESISFKQFVAKLDAN